MRLSQERLRVSILNARETINEVFKLNDSELKLWVKNALPIAKVEEETREELLRFAMQDVIYMCFEKMV